MYRRSSEKFRRLLNQALFDKPVIIEDEVVDHELREPFADLVEAQIRIGRANNEKGVGKRRRLQTEPVALAEMTNADLWVRVLSGHGSNKNEMVGVPGFEPGASASRRR